MEFLCNNGKWKYKTSIKEKAFEVFVLGIVEWWLKQNPLKNWKENDLSSLKIQKLLFFSSALGSTPKENEDGLLNIFNNWVAMPYGPFEKDIIDIIKYRKGQFNYFKIGNHSLILK